MSDSCNSMDCSLQASLSMGFSRQEYWSGLRFPSPGNLPNPGIKPRSPALWADALPTEPQGKLSQLRSRGQRGKAVISQKARLGLLAHLGRSRGGREQLWLTLGTTMLVVNISGSIHLPLSWGLTSCLGH